MMASLAFNELSIKSENLTTKITNSAHFKLILYFNSMLWNNLHQLLAKSIELTTNSLKQVKLIQ